MQSKLINEISNKTPLYVCSDGGYRMHHNVGAFAYIIVQNNIIIKQHVEIIKDATNNICEYLGMLNGIRALESINISNSHIILMSDSMLMINQITGKWKINNPKLRELKNEICNEGKRVIGTTIVEFVWHSDDNYWIKECDKLCDDAISAFLKQ